MKRLAIEIILITAISLFLSLLYNSVSRTGIRILPKQSDKSAAVLRGDRIMGQKWLWFHFYQGS